MPCYSCVISADTERAVEILTRYQSTLRSPEEQELKASIGKVSHIFQSELFQALLAPFGVSWPFLCLDP
uniref:L27-1 domain-containing protein n=1 Tax=Buteo japonicus TaxID=224669 RepID=A0A8C0BYN2_9AVES